MAGMNGGHRSSNGKLLPVFCIALSLGLLIAGLWPFRFRTANNVHRIADSPGLRFDRYGIVTAKDPLFGPGRPVDLAFPFTLRMEVIPREESSDSLPRILSAYDADGRELFFLGQWRSELILRILKEERSFHLYSREVGVEGLEKGVKRTIVVRSDNNVLTLFVDGVPAKTRSGVSFTLLPDKRAPAWVILGNSPTGETPWRGDLLSLSFYPKALTPGDIDSRGTPPVLQYAFSEGGGAVCRGGSDSRYDLVIPSLFRAPKKGILVPTWKVQKFERSFWKDVFVNILGFLPFGIAVYAWARKGGERKDAVAMGIALLLGAGISLSIELLQAYLPNRDSSLTDVINNVLGTYFGARLLRTVRGILHR